MKEKTQMDWLLAAPIAHRGLHGADIPENSIPAYEKAIEIGFNIEIDVHLSKDNQIVVFHDDNLKRVCGVDKKIRNCTVEELKTYRLKGTDCTIPTFDEFLALVDGKVGILCEIKGILPWDLSIVKATVERIKTYKGNIAIQSFNFGPVIYARRHSDRPFGSLCTWRGHNHMVDFLGKLWVTKLTKPMFIAYDVRDILGGNKYVEKARKTTPIITWTVNNTEKLACARKCADNIIFEDIADLLLTQN